MLRIVPSVVCVLFFAATVACNDSVPSDHASEAPPSSSPSTTPDSDVFLPEPAPSGESMTTAKLDASYGKAGKFSLAVNNLDAEVFAMAVQKDGSVLLGGSSSLKDGVAPFTLMRVTAQGAADLSFNKTGIVTTICGKNPEAADDAIYGLAISADGKILAGGSSLNDGNLNFAIARYNTDGSLDESFATGGKLLTRLGTNRDDVYGIATDSQGRVLAVGVSYVEVSESEPLARVALLRLTKDGAVDATFGPDKKGFVITKAGGSDSNGLNLAVQADDKVVVVGYGYAKADSTASNGILLRYNSDGSLDESFGTKGIVSTKVGQDDILNSVLILEDKSIVVAGRTTVVAEGKESEVFLLEKYQESGTFVESFGQGGFATVPVTTAHTANSSAIGLVAKSDGKLLLVGNSSGTLVKKVIALAQFESNGRLDKSFGKDGVQTLSTNGYEDRAVGAGVTAEGKIMIGGYTLDDESRMQQYAVYRVE